MVYLNSHVLKLLPVLFDVQRNTPKITEGTWGFNDILDRKFTRYSQHWLVSFYQSWRQLQPKNTDDLCFGG